MLKNKTFTFFFKAYPAKTILAIFLLFMAGITEIIGITAFLPFLQIIFEGGTSLDQLPDGLFRTFLAYLNIDLTFTSMSLFIIFAISLKALLLWLAMQKVSETVSYVSHDLRTRLMRALLNARWRFFVNNALGSNLNSLVMETYRSSLAFISLSSFIASFIQFLVYVIAAFLVSWKVALFGLVTGALIGSALWSLVRIAGRAGHKTTNITITLLTRMGDVIQGIKTMRVMALENEFLKLLQGYSHELRSAQATKLKSIQAMQIAHEPLMVLAAIGGLFAIISIERLPTGELALMAVIFIRMLMGLNKAQGQYQSYVVEESALSSLLDTITNIENNNDHWDGKQNVPDKVNHIRFENVSFSYDEKSVLSAINLDLKRGELTALYGASGSGKTTILDLLCGFYKAFDGRILIEDEALETLDLNMWRQAIGFVPQDVFLFNDTIAENIRLGRQHISDDMIKAAIEDAGASDFVQSLPLGIHASVGENGRMLSGGQKQRIAIARAISHKPKIILLDEATSALDQNTETHLLETLKALSQNMIVLLSTHNPSVMDYADTIYKIRDGQIETVSNKQN